MISAHRKRFNSEFTEAKYKAFLDAIASDFDYRPTFRIAETPFFIPKELKEQILEGSKQVIDFIKREDFKEITQKSLLINSNVPNEDKHTQFLAIDFGVCEENGKIIPKLIEVQGFPSIFNFQFNLFKKLKASYPFLDQLSPYLEGLDEQGYYKKFEETVLKGFNPEEVILLEIEPEKQNTKIDFYYCNKDFNIPICCVTEVTKKGNQLYYNNPEGKEIRIRRIYNRVIFDELELRKDLKMNFSFMDDLDVEWAGHPNWFFRISKFILPYLHGPYFIESKLLSELNEIPADLENYVLKPLFSFSGSGVIFHVKKEDIENVKEKDLYILQRKVNYAPVVDAIEGKVKAEVRILAVWPEGDDSPTLMGNLVRLSRGEMIGVKFNKDKDWVGGTLGLFEKS
ncbi:hypothetical protein A33Q_2856 [Indibacter alkaliphilus LW1]|jgi:hypothetical protein|uniref:Circularly permuted ATP-grasp type 2 n=1 Tax=Indibacter alkaliphilus (strain CCUG 57479 / KCTC 22604 / LW1) TaxID=1189612 RepID=S2D9D7_INDAL|nr:hypothetical protein [Indibacter alkaliphilus]EOZ95494.1 hypothetical protein A33Q_2856 [Indibacter alkaliphilus LW1]